MFFSTIERRTLSASAPPTHTPARASDAAVTPPNGFANYLDIAVSCKPAFLLLNMCSAQQKADVHVHRFSPCQ